MYISDGRKSFYQWDAGQKLIVEEPNVNQVHFTKELSGQTITKEVHVEENGVKWVEVPQEFLETIRDIIAYAFIINLESESTIVQNKFRVLPRPKPDAYVSEDFPLGNRYWTDINSRLTELEWDVIPIVNDDGVLDFEDKTGDPSVDDKDPSKLLVSDKTLSLDGKFADAKVTGDKINELLKKIQQLENMIT